LLGDAGLSDRRGKRGEHRLWAPAFKEKSRTGKKKKRKCLFVKKKKRVVEVRSTVSLVRDVAEKGRRHDQGGWQRKSGDALL